MDYPTNRDRRLAPKKGLTWCRGCDCYKVWDGQKCPVCRRRHDKRRFKK